MGKIHFYRIVDELSNPAFDQYAGMTFDLFKYNVMKIDEFRKVDLKEKLHEFSKEFGNYDKKIKHFLIDYDYATEILFYLDNYAVYEPGSRAEKYYHRAKEILDDAKVGQASTDDLEDLTRIYISVMREEYQSIENGKIITIKDIDFTVYKEDEDMLREIKQLRFAIPKDGLEKGFADVLQKIKKGSDEALTKYKDKKSMYFVYMISALLYCRAMQSEGRYSSEGEEND